MTLSGISITILPIAPPMVSLRLLETGTLCAWKEKDQVKKNYYSVINERAIMRTTG